MSVQNSESVPTAALVCDQPETVGRVYDPKTLAALNRAAGLTPTVYTREMILDRPESLTQIKYLFSTWGMPVFSEEEIRRYFPKLESVFYAAGTVQAFARPFLNNGVHVHSAWAANAIPVAEYTVSQIVLANKGFFAAAPRMSRGEVSAARDAAAHYPGNFGARVGIIGAGMIGSLVIRMLSAYALPVLVFDPFLSDEAARELGVRKGSLEELFSTCSVISNHLANNEQTRGMLTGALFSRMQPYAVFLNTGRGAQVVEAELADVLQKRPDLTAILDVTFPEPPEAGHPFYTLPNCILTPHIAGSSGTEVCRMAQFMLQEFERTVRGLQPRYEVSMRMLETMA